MAADLPDQASRSGRRKGLAEQAAALEPEQVGAAAAARLAGVSEATWWRLHAAAMVPRPNRLGARTLWQVNGPNGLREWIRQGCPSREQFENTRSVAARRDSS